LVFKGIFIFQIFLLLFTEISDWIIALYSTENCELDYWKERNARVFNNKVAPPTVLLDIIKSEVRLWITAGAKHLSLVMVGE
jgi:hypothetical protein